MKKLTTLGTALVSVLALTACGETDTREKHMYTVEVEVTDTNGKVQTVTKECKQLQKRCVAAFSLETPYGPAHFEFNASNEPLNPEKLMAKASAAKSNDERDKIIDTEYKQDVYLDAIKFSSTYGPRFNGPRLEKTKWKPKTERIIKTELNIPHPELIKKHISLMELRAARNKKNHWDRTKKEWDYMVSQTAELKKLNMPEIKAADLRIRIY